MSHTTRRILRMSEIRARTGLSKSQIYNLIRKGEFPSLVRLSAQSVGGHEHEVDAWIDARPRTRTTDRETS